jgi:hypothetical protein
VVVRYCKKLPKSGYLRVYGSFSPPLLRMSQPVEKPVWGLQLRPPESIVRTATSEDILWTSLVARACLMRLPHRGFALRGSLEKSTQVEVCL